VDDSQRIPSISLIASAPLVDHAAEEEPDVPELVRGKTGRVNGTERSADADEGTAARVQQGQPGRQEKPLFDTADTYIDTLRIYADMTPASA